MVVMLQLIVLVFVMEMQQLMHAVNVEGMDLLVRLNVELKFACH